MKVYNPLETGTRIKKQRQLLGYSRDDLAAKSGITSRYCYDLEQGLKNMSVSTLCSIAEALDLSIDYLIYGLDSKTSKHSSIQSLIEDCPDMLIPYLENIISNFILGATKR